MGLMSLFSLVVFMVYGYLYCSVCSMLQKSLIEVKYYVSFGKSSFL